jgi:hypothetical protein
MPFDTHELLSRVRSQLRNKHTADELRVAEDNRNTTRQVVEAVKEERRTLRLGAIATVGILVVAGLISLFFHRRTQQENTRVYAAITRLQTGILTQQNLMERSRRVLDDGERRPAAASDPQKLQLQKKSEELRSQLASRKIENASALQDQVDHRRKPPPEARDREQGGADDYPDV